MRVVQTLAALSLVWVMGVVQADEPLPDQWSYLSLGSHWKVSSMLDGQVYSSDGRPVGQLHDLIFDHEGGLRRLVVESETRGGWRYLALKWGETRYSSAVDSLTLDVSMAEIEAMEWHEQPDFAGDDYEASNLVGLLVDAGEATRWGQVTDLLIAPAERGISALVVQSLGVGRLQYAVPPNWSGVDYGEHRASLPYSSAVIEEQGRMGSGQSPM